MVSAILIIILLTIANGIFAMSEAAVISARKAKLQQQANAGDARARAALALADNPNRFLSTVQVGITLIGILAGAFGEATLADDLETGLERVPWLAPYSRAISLGIMVVVLTYLSLIIGELVPKRLALRNPESIAGLVAAPMNFLSAVVNPAVHVLSVSTEAILRLLGVQPSTAPPVTEEEIRVLIQQGTQAGIFEVAEQDMVEAVFRLNDQRAFDLMTPRPEIIWLDLNDSPQEIIAKITESGYSRFPVCHGSLDNVLGVVRAKDLLARSLAGEPLDLRGAMRSPIFVPESALAFQVLELFRGSQPHLALVIDEYGGTQGLITLHDILEAIVGEVEVTEPQAVQRQDGSWLLDGALAVEEFKEIFDLGPLPEEERDYYQTLGGFVMMLLGRVPTAGDHFQWAGLRFEVMDMDGKRVDKVLVVPASGQTLPEKL
ncbi:MAG: HlyC/CorC family transporter [Ignavibacteriaceae bacterium]|nr:HlyC/CorC family transporter [Ignavibacteriaceae bacterium]